LRQVGLLAQLEIQAKLHEQMIEQRRTQAAIGWRMQQAGSKAVLGRGQLQRLAQHVVLQRMMLQHLCSMLHATTVDLHNEQISHDLVSAGHAPLAPVADVFEGVDGLDEGVQNMQFPFDLAEHHAGAAEPLHTSTDSSHIEVEATPLTSAVMTQSIEPV
jgi:hypothetical protein